MRQTILAICLAAALGGVHAGAAAQQRGGRGGDQLSPAEVIRVLDGYAVVQAQEALQLSDNQYGAFVTRLRKLQETRRRQQQARNQLLMDLRRLVGPQAAAVPDEAVVKEKLAALQAHEERAAGELRAAYASLDEVLDARQQARFRLFEESLERRKLDLIMRARRQAGS